MLMEIHNLNLPNISNIDKRMSKSYITSLMKNEKSGKNNAKQFKYPLTLVQSEILLDIKTDTAHWIDFR